MLSMIGRALAVLVIGAVLIVPGASAMHHSWGDGSMPRPVPIPAPLPKPAPLPSPAPVPAPAPIPGFTLDAREIALRDAVNDVRVKYGLSAIAVREDLTNGARAHTADMIARGYFAHSWSDGTPFGTWARRYSSCLILGEILAWRMPEQTAQLAIGQWLNSPPHREALLASSTWQGMGIELTANHATVLFGGRC